MEGESSTMRIGQWYVIISMMILIVTLLVSRFILKKSWSSSILVALLIPAAISFANGISYRVFGIDIVIFFERLIGQ